MSTRIEIGEAIEVNGRERIIRKFIHGRSRPGNVPPKPFARAMKVDLTEAATKLNPNRRERRALRKGLKQTRQATG
jgi:hypothetical protein